MGQACNSETTVGEEGPSQIQGGGTVSPGLDLMGTAQACRHFPFAPAPPLLE